MHELPPNFEKELWRYSLRRSHDNSDQPQLNDRDYRSTDTSRTDNTDNGLFNLSVLSYFQHFQEQDFSSQLCQHQRLIYYFQSDLRASSVIPPALVTTKPISILYTDLMRATLCPPEMGQTTATSRGAARLKTLHLFPPRPSTSLSA